MANVDFVLTTGALAQVTEATRTYEEKITAHEATVAALAEKLKDLVAAQEALQEVEARQGELVRRLEEVKQEVGVAVLVGGDEGKEGARIAALDYALKALEPTLRGARRNVRIAYLAQRAAYALERTALGDAKDALPQVHYAEALELMERQTRRDGGTYLHPPRVGQDGDAFRSRIEASQAHQEAEQGRLWLDKEFPL